MSEIKICSAIGNPHPHFDSKLKQQRVDKSKQDNGHAEHRYAEELRRYIHSLVVTLFTGKME